MSSIEDFLSKRREERMARERARIDKLRELNLKKYNKNDIQQKSSTFSVSLPKSKSNISCPTKNNLNLIQTNSLVSGSSKQPISAIPKKPINYVTANKNVLNVKSKVAINGNKDKSTRIRESVVNKTENAEIIKDRKHNPLQEIVVKNDVKDTSKITKHTITKDSVTNELKSHYQIGKCSTVGDKLNYKGITGQSSNTTTKKESVFDRLYKPKILPKLCINNSLKLHTDPNYLKKVIKDSTMIMTGVEAVTPVRLSISAVDLQQMSKNEFPKSIHKWASIGEKINNVPLKDKNEDDFVKNKSILSTVRSEKKKVKFQTPHNFNTPRPEEMQSRLLSWLQKRGKSIESYQHLQCFGVHHLSKEIRHLDLSKYENNDDENKENIALEHDSDNDSFHENMNNGNDDTALGNKVDFPVDTWRRASYYSDSEDFNESHETLTSCGTTHQVDELLVGVLNDLTELLREGFEWEQCARWLRVVRERFPLAMDTASYWECRAALEERRGDLPASLQCWEQAVANGTEHSVVEANLDHLLDKFMQLKISPTSGKKQLNPKLVDIKNVFKSTIIRFGVQQAKLRQSNEPVKYTVTPVRRSSRLSVYYTPLRLCATLQEASELGPIEFVPNKALNKTP